MRHEEPILGWLRTTVLEGFKFNASLVSLKTASEITVILNSPTWGNSPGDCNMSPDHFCVSKLETLYVRVKSYIINFACIISLY